MSIREAYCLHFEHMEINRQIRYSIYMEIVSQFWTLYKKSCSKVAKSDSHIQNGLIKQVFTDNHWPISRRNFGLRDFSAWTPNVIKLQKYNFRNLSATFLNRWTYVHHWIDMHRHIWSNLALHNEPPKQTVIVEVAVYCPPRVRRRINCQHSKFFSNW